jgi:hypothetical protein
MDHISSLRIGKMAGSSLRGLERSPGVSQKFSFVLISLASHSIALLLNVLEFMPHLQHTPRERIDVFDKVFAHSNFSLYVASSADRGC